MNQLIELQSIRDLSQYIANQTEAQSYDSIRRKLYLYVYNKSHNYQSQENAPCHIDAGTIHIGIPSGTYVKNRDNVFYDRPALDEKLGWTLDQDRGWMVDPHVKQDIGDSIVIHYCVYYELRPGATRFENKRECVSGILFEEVSVFDMGDIGYELAKITPEQAAEKYFGHSDFTKFFSNYAVTSKQMSLTPRERRSLGIERISLTGMHPVKPPSSFREYVNAGKQLFSGKHQVNPDVTPSKTASVLAGAAGGLMLTSGRPLGAIATLSLPFLGTIHSRIRQQQQLNQLQRTKTVALSNEEREKLLAKGALASELTRRLTTNPTQFGRNMLFGHVHSHVHRKPTSDRTRWSPKRRGGRKMRRTRKK
jgi:hypothetical protein